MSYKFKREDADFYSEGTRCSAWLYLPESDKKSPIIVMAHGLGGTREMRLCEFAERFAACSKDDLAPADKTIELSKKAEKSTCKRYDCGHFQIYSNEYFEEAIVDYINFYNQAI